MRQQKWKLILGLVAAVSLLTACCGQESTSGQETGKTENKTEAGTSDKDNTGKGDKEEGTSVKKEATSFEIKVAGKTYKVQDDVREMVKGLQQGGIEVTYPSGSVHNPTYCLYDEKGRYTRIETKENSIALLENISRMGNRNFFQVTGLMNGNVLTYEMPDGMTGTSTKEDIAKLKNCMISGAEGDRGFVLIADGAILKLKEYQNIFDMSDEEFKEVRKAQGNRGSFPNMPMLEQAKHQYIVSDVWTRFQNGEYDNAGYVFYQMSTDDSGKEFLRTSISLYGQVEDADLEDRVLRMKYCAEEDLADYWGNTGWDVYRERYPEDITIESVTLEGDGEELTQEYVQSVLGEKTGFYEVTLGSGIKTIGEKAFAECEKMTAIQIPETVTSIGRRAFYRCGCLEEINWPDSSLEVSNGVFFDCKSLKKIDLPEGVVNIDADAFYGCALENIDFPKSVTNIGSNAFYKCNLETVTIPEGITTISNSAFSTCTKLKKVVFPESITTIGASAFQYCTALTDFQLPSGLTDIGDTAFHDCKSLENVEIPAGVVNIGYSAFGGTAWLEKEQMLIYNNVVLDVSENLQGEVTVPEGVTRIGDGAFSNTLVTKVILPNTVTSIGYRGFAYSTLAEIQIPVSVTEMGEEAFTATSLTSITIPGSIALVPKQEFHYCGSLTDVVFEEGVTTIEATAFGECRQLSNIQFSSTVTTLGYDAFIYCESLNKVYVPSTVTDISIVAFRFCDNIVIQCHRGSVAETVAKDARDNYEYVD